MACHYADGSAVCEVVSREAAAAAFLQKPKTPKPPTRSFCKRREIQIKQGIRTRCTRTNGHSWQCGNVKMTDSLFCEYHKACLGRSKNGGSSKAQEMQYSMSGIAPPKEYRPRRRCSELCTDGAHGGRSDGESETEYYEQKVAQGILNGTLIVKDVVYLEQGVPKREASAVTLLAPWMGILVNIDNSRKNLAGLKLVPGAEEIKEKFKVRCCNSAFTSISKMGCREKACLSLSLGLRCCEVLC
jgi:hypothetical protein